MTIQRIVGGSMLYQDASTPSVALSANSCSRQSNQLVITYAIQIEFAEWLQLI